MRRESEESVALVSTACGSLRLIGHATDAFTLASLQHAAVRAAKEVLHLKSQLS